jgi:hypothetical protein
MAYTKRPFNYWGMLLNQVEVDLNSANDNFDILGQAFIEGDPASKPIKKSVYIGTSPPSDVGVGTLWLDTSEISPILKIWDGRQWIIIGEAGGTGGEVPTQPVTGNVVIRPVYSNGWGLNKVYYSNIYKDVSGQVRGVRPGGLAFSSDGTKMYIIGSRDYSLIPLVQYSLSVPWEVDTASVSYVLNLYPLLYSASGGVTSDACCLVFKSDGSVFYVIYFGERKVYQFNLSIAWDISTTSYSNKNFYIGNQTGTPQGLAFNSEGTKMYVLGDNEDKIFQYTLSTPWDISTANYDNIYFYIFNLFSGIAFKTEGTKLYTIVYTGTVYQCTLSIPWNVGSAVYDNINYNTMTPTGEPTYMYDVDFSQDGTRMYVLGYGSKKVFEFFVGESSEGGNLVVGGTVTTKTSYTPSGTNDPNGEVGTIVWDNNYLYVKTKVGWKRVALSTF